MTTRRRKKGPDKPTDPTASTAATPKIARGATAPEGLRVRVKASADAHGVAKSATALGLSVEPFCRLIAGLHVHKGTVAQAMANLDKLDALDQGKRSAA